MRAWHHRLQPATPGALQQTLAPYLLARPWFGACRPVPGAAAVDSDRTRHGAISDQFTKDTRTLTCFWSQTPWSDARWDGGVLSSPEAQRQAWRIEGDGGVMTVLKS